MLFWGKLNCFLWNEKLYCRTNVKNLTKSFKNPF
jgi:hypothetical protein